MTENTSSENLHKFLESEDPAMVTMGLSMAKGSGVSEETLPIILKMYMLNEDKNIRSMAKSVFTKWAPDEIQLKVKQNWKANYRTISITADKYPDIVKPFLDAFKSNDDIAMIVLNPLLNIYSKKIESTDWERWGGRLKLEKKRRKAGENLTKIADIRTLGPLTKVLLRKNDGTHYRMLAAKALGNIGDKRAVKPLIASIDTGNDRQTDESIRALANIGDARAIKPIISIYLKNNRGKRFGTYGNTYYLTGGCRAALEKGKWKWTNKPEVKEIIKLLKGGRTKIEPKPPDSRRQNKPSGKVIGRNQPSRMWTPEQLKIRKKWAEYDEKQREYRNWKKFRRPWARAFVATHLGKIGDERAVKPLIKILNHENTKIVEAAAKSLGEIGDERAVDPLIKILNHENIKIVETAAKSLGEIGDERALKPLLDTLGKENLRLIKTSANAIIKIKKGKIEEEKNILKFIRNRDSAMVLMGASMLKGIIEETEEIK